MIEFENYMQKKPMQEYQKLLQELIDKYSAFGNRFLNKIDSHEVRKILIDLQHTYNVCRINELKEEELSYLKSIDDKYLKKEDITTPMHVGKYFMGKVRLSGRPTSNIVLNGRLSGDCDRVFFIYDGDAENKFLIKSIVCRGLVFCDLLSNNKIAEEVAYVARDGVAYLYYNFKENADD